MIVQGAQGEQGLRLTPTIGYCTHDAFIHQIWEITVWLDPYTVGK